MDTSKTTGNLDLWLKLETTDPNFTKRFDKGNFKGTAVDAVYNIKRVTERLGPVGFAWGWHVAREELRKFGDGQSEIWIHNCVLRAWFRQPDDSVREVEQIGSTIAARWVGKGTKYFMVDDEYAKKSVTDALSKIMLSLGASADIWLGRFDGNKYLPPAGGNEDEPDRAGAIRPLPDPMLLHEAQLHLRNMTSFNEGELRGVRDWLASSADGKGASRWIRLGVQDPEVREQLAAAMNTRAQELGVSLKGGSAA